MKRQNCEELLYKLISHHIVAEQIPNNFIQRRRNRKYQQNFSIPSRFTWLTKFTRQNDKDRDRSQLLSRQSRHHFSTLCQQNSKPLTTSLQFRQQEFTNHIDKQHTHEIQVHTDAAISILQDVNIDLQEKHNRSVAPRERNYRTAKTTQSNHPKEQLKLCEKKLDLPPWQLHETRYTPKNLRQIKDIRIEKQHSLSRKSNITVNPQWLLTQKLTLQQQSHPQSRKHYRNLTGHNRKLKSRKQHSEIPIRAWENWEQNQNLFEDYDMT